MPSPPLPQRLLLTAFVALAVLAPALLQAQPPPPPSTPGGPSGRTPGTGPQGGPQTPPSAPPAATLLAPRPRIIAFAANGTQWVWLKPSAGEVALYSGGPNARPVELARGKGWTDVALDGANMWVVQRTGRKGTLLRFGAAPGAAPTPELRNLDRPGSLIAAHGTLYWLESVPRPPSAPSFVPLAGGVLRLRTREAGGQVRTISEWPAQQDDARSPAPGDIIALDADVAYVRVRRLASTEFLRMPLRAESPTRIAAAGGLQEALFHRGQFYWTAPTEEATTASGLRCVRRLRADSVAETLTDWLPDDGRLLSIQGQPYYAGDALYLLPQNLGVATPVRSSPGHAAATDGASLILLGELDAPLALPIRPR